MNLGPVIAALRHVGTYAAGIVTGLMLIGVKQDSAQQIVDAIVQMSSGLAEVLQAVGVIAPIVIGLFSALSATSSSRVKGIANMTMESANAAVASLPDSAKNAIHLAIIPAETKIAAVAAMPDVAAIVVKNTATDGVAKAAADPSLPKVVVQP